MSTLFNFGVFEIAACIGAPVVALTFGFVLLRYLRRNTTA
jgi:hypothetical protein